MRVQSHGFAVHREIRVLSTASRRSASQLRSEVNRQGALKQEGVQQTNVKQGLGVTLSWSRLVHGTGTLAGCAFCQPILKERHIHENSAHSPL